jgi:hypothetical protein
MSIEKLTAMCKHDETATMTPLSERATPPMKKLVDVSFYTTSWGTIQNDRIAVIAGDAAGIVLRSMSPVRSGD